MADAVPLRLLNLPTVTTTALVHTRIDLINGLFTHGDFKYLVGTSSVIGVGWCFFLESGGHESRWRRVKKDVGLFFRHGDGNDPPGTLYVETEEDRMAYRPEWGVPEDTVWVACKDRRARNVAINQFVET